MTVPEPVPIRCPGFVNDRPGPMSILSRFETLRVSKVRVGVSLPPPTNSGSTSTSRVPESFWALAANGIHSSSAKPARESRRTRRMGCLLCLWFKARNDSQLSPPDWGYRRSFRFLIAEEFPLVGIAVRWFTFSFRHRRTANPLRIRSLPAPRERIRSTGCRRGAALPGCPADQIRRGWGRSTSYR